MQHLSLVRHTSSRIDVLPDAILNDASIEHRVKNDPDPNHTIIVKGFARSILVPGASPRRVAKFEVWGDFSEVHRRIGMVVGGRGDDGVRHEF